MADATATVTTPAPVPTPSAPGGSPQASAPAPVIPPALLEGLKAAGINPDTMEMALVVDGETLNIPLPIVRSRAQKSSGADKRFKEADDRMKAIDRAYQTAAKDPEKFWEAASMLGLNPDDLALQRVEAALAREAAQARETPAERKLREENEGYKKRDQEAAQKKAADERMARVNAHIQQRGKLLYDAVEKTSLPHTDATALRMVSLMERADEQGLDLSPEALAHYAEEEVMAEVQAVLSAQKDTKKRRKLVGEDLLQAILRGDVEAVTAAPGAPAAPPAAQPTRAIDEDTGETVVRFKPTKKAKPEAQAIRELTRALKSGSMPRPV